jgi:hypothetical protein
MALKSPSYGPHQGELLTFLPQTGQLIAADVYKEPVPEDGISVKIDERAIALGTAVTELASASKLTGFEIATSNAVSPGMRASIEKRYDDVDRITGNAHDKRARHLLSAKQAFARAAGLPQMISAETDASKHDDIKAEVAKDFEYFVQKYGDAKGARPRNDLRKTLKRTERELAKASRNSAS